jgi:hypothetical protein
MSSGAQWRAEVQAALAGQAKARRQRRGRRKQDASSFRVGHGKRRKRAPIGAHGRS